MICETPLEWKQRVCLHGSCILTGEPGHVCAGPLQAHHVITQQALKKHKRTDLLWDTDNGVPVCEGGHARHTKAIQRIPLRLLPEAAHRFATRVGLEWQLIRYYHGGATPMTETITWEGAEALRPFLIPINDLEPSEENPRKGDVMALVGSLRRFGQVRGLAVAGNGTKIVAGHHLRLAALELGWTHIAVVPNDFKDEQEQRAYLLADNRLATLGGYDDAQQMSILDDLLAGSDGKGLEGTGYTHDAYEDLRAQMGAVPSTEAAEQALDRGHNEDAVAAAERAAALAQSRQMKEVVLLIDQDQHAQLGADLKILQTAYRSTETPEPGVILSILRAVHEMAEMYTAGQA